VPPSKPDDWLTPDNKENLLQHLWDDKLLRNTMQSAMKAYGLKVTRGLSDTAVRKALIDFLTQSNDAATHSDAEDLN
jgi:hypothetical protein